MPGTMAPRAVQVWDPLLRFWHWTLAALVLAAFLTGDDLERLHLLLGYTIVALLGLRLIWGVVGPRQARFANFVRGPRAVVAYLRGLVAGTAPRHLGHNPAGAAMIVALLLALAGSALTGHLAVQPGAGKAWEEAHEVLANGTMLLVALHVAGVVVASLVHRENLVRAMLTGRKAAPRPGDVA